VYDCAELDNIFTYNITTNKRTGESAGLQQGNNFHHCFNFNICKLLCGSIIIDHKKKYKSTETFHLIIAISGMVLSWVLIHPIFTLRYAHIFHGDDEEKPEIHAAGLEFPHDKKPDYLDFAYFSLVLGMTFQVSDVQVTSKRLRRLAMLHGILAFGYYTIMIALTINLIAGFGN